MQIARVLSTGLGMTFQDRGRAGWRRYGVPPGGAMDERAAQSANWLVGNLPDATVLELVLQRAELEFLNDCWVAVTGADASSDIPVNHACLMKKGSVLRFPANKSGVWIYLAIAGGWKCQRWLESSSVYERAGIGTLIKEGTVLEAHFNQAKLVPYPSQVYCRRLTEALMDRYDEELIVPLYPGPQFDSFSAEAKYLLTQTSWSVSSRSDRTGFRFDGAELENAPEITSEPVLPGSMQVPPGGKPIVTMVDGPTVGGYPKIAYIEPKDRRRLAQCRPGSRVRFKWLEETTSSLTAI